MKKLRQKFFLIFSVFFLIPLLVLGTIVWALTQKETLSALEDSVHHFVTTKNSELQYYYDWSSAVVLVLAKNISLQGPNAKPSDISTTLKHFQDTYWGKFHHIFLIDKDGSIISSPKGAMGMNHLGQDLTGDAWLQKVFKTKKPIISSYNSWTEADHYHEVLFMPVFDNNNNIISVIGIELNIAYIIEILKQSETMHATHNVDLSALNNLDISFYASNGLQIQHDNTTKAPILSDEILKRAHTGEFILDIEDDGVVNAYLQNHSGEWIVGATIKDHRLLKVLSRIELLYLVLAAVLILVTIIMMMLFHKIIIAPIQNLTKDAQGFADDIDATLIETKTNDEIGILADTLRYAQSKIKEAHLTLTDQVQARTESLRKKVEELERWSNVTVEREMAMIALKKKLKELLEKEYKQSKK